MIDFATITILVGVAVMLVQQILKLKLVPFQFANKYPVPTNIILSIIASVIATFTKTATIVGWKGWVAFITLVVIVSAGTYNATLRNWQELRSMEG